MASIDVGIHPDPPEAARAAALTSAVHDWFVDRYDECVHFDKGHGPYAMCKNPEATVPVSALPAIFDALQAALDEIRLDMGRAEQVAMAAKRAARADEIRADMDAAAPLPVCGCAHAHALCGAYCHASEQAAKTAEAVAS